MNREETARLYAVMVAYYPECFRNNSTQEAKAWVNAWTDALGAFSYPQISMAFKMYIQGANCKFPPKPGELIALINRTNPDHPDNGCSEMDAWGMVQHAVGNSSYNAQDEFSRLPPDIRDALGRPEVLKEMAMDESYFDHSGVYQSNFLKSYRAIQERRKQDAQYSPEIRTAINDARKNATVYVLPADSQAAEDARREQADEAAQIRINAHQYGGRDVERAKAELIDEILQKLVKAEDGEA